MLHSQIKINSYKVFINYEEISCIKHDLEGLLILEIVSHYLHFCKYKHTQPAKINRCYQCFALYSCPIQLYPERKLPAARYQFFITIMKYMQPTTYEDRRFVWFTALETQGPNGIAQTLWQRSIPGCFTHGIENNVRITRRTKQVITSQTRSREDGLLLLQHSSPENSKGHTRTSSRLQ